MKKIYGIVCAVIMCVLGVYVAVEIKRPMPIKTVPVVQRRELPIAAKTITVGKNRYGDYLAGIIAQQNQDYQKMAAYYEKALSDDKDNQKIKTSLYLLKMIAGKVDEALPLARDLQKTKQGQLLTEYVLAADAVQKKEYEAALKIINEKAKYGLDPVLVPMMKGWILSAQGKDKEADEVFKKAEQNKARFEYYRALLAAKTGDIKKAEKHMANVKKMLPQGFPSLSAVVFVRDFGFNQQGVDAFLAGSPLLKEVISAIAPEKEITPEMGLAIGFYDTSVALAPLKSKEASLVFNALAIKMAPEMVIPKIWGAELLEGTQNYHAANRLYQTIQPTNDVVMIKMIVNDVADEKYDKALPLAEDVLSHNQKDASLWALTGDIYAKVKNYDKAIECYEKAVELYRQKGDQENTGNAYLGLASICEERGGRAEKVEEYLLKAMELIPNNPLVLNFLGYTWLEENKNINRAFAMVEKAHQLMPEEAEIMDSLAYGYYLKKEYNKALPLAEQAIDGLPFSSVAYAHLGDIYRAMGQPRNARYQYQKALALQKDMTPKLKSELEEKLKAVQN